MMSNWCEDELFSLLVVQRSVDGRLGYSNRSCVDTIACDPAALDKKYLHVPTEAHLQRHLFNLKPDEVSSRLCAKPVDITVLMTEATSLS